MKNGAIYAYYNHDNHPVYVGSVQNHARLLRRHRTHFIENKGLLCRWLRSGNEDTIPVILERVDFDQVEQLFDRENYWMKKLGTLLESGGFNLIPAGGPDHAAIGSAGGKLGGIAVQKLYPNLSKENWKRVRELYPDICSRAGKVGGKVTFARYGNPATFESRQKGGLIGGSKGGRKIHDAEHRARPEYYENCVKRGRRTIELHGNPGTPEGRQKGGHRGGTRTHDDEHKSRPGYFEHQSSAGKLGGRIGGKVGGPKAMHLRWHIKRGLVNPACKYCAEAA